MNGTVHELEQLFKNRSVTDVLSDQATDSVVLRKPRISVDAGLISPDGFLRVRQNNQLFKDVLRSNQEKAALVSPLRPVIADVNFSPEPSKKYTSKFVEVKKRFIPAAQRVADRCLLTGVICNDVYSALQGLARVIYAVCSVKRSHLSPGLPSPARPKSWSVTSSGGSGSPEQQRPRQRVYTTSPNMAACKSNESLDDVGSVGSNGSRRSSREGMGTLDSLFRVTRAKLDPLKRAIGKSGCEKLNGEQFGEILSVLRDLCIAVTGDLEMDIIEEDEGTFDITAEVFTRKRQDLIDVVEAHFENGQTQVTLPTVGRSQITRRSKSCVVKKPEQPMRRTLSDARKYFGKSKSQDNTKTSIAGSDSQETVRDSVISNSSTSSSGSYDDEGLAKNIPRWQRKKMQQALVQTQLPAGFNTKRRTSSTITKDEALLLGVTMSQIVKNSAIGEETESDLDDTRASTWRDSGIDTNSSTVTSFNPSLSDEDDEEFRQQQRSLSPLHGSYNGSYDSAVPPTEEFLSIKLGTESKKALGQSPNTMGKHFQIHVKTNIERLQLQSYVIHKKFKDIIQLYEDIEHACPEGVATLERPDKSIWTKQNKMQVERLLLSIANNNKLRVLEPVISFLKPDCLLTEDTTSGSGATVLKTPQCNTPPDATTTTTASSGGTAEISRDHPNSANQEVEIAKFYTPNSSSGSPGTDHAPQVIHSQNGNSGDQGNIVTKTLKFLNHQKSTTEGMDAEERVYDPYITKDDEGNPILLMMYNQDRDNYAIEGGTLEQLVELLYSGNAPDADYIQTFLLGYKMFMQPEELMSMLISKFEECEDYPVDVSDMVKLRLSNILTQWIERVWVDFHYSDVMKEKVDRFIVLVSSGHPHFIPVALKLETTKTKKEKEWEESLREDDRTPGSLPGSGCNSPASSPPPIRRSNSDTKNQKRKPLGLGDITSSQFARHLHCADFDMLAKVELHEYFSYFCRKKDPRYNLLKRHLDNWIAHWNRVTAWVTSEILRDEHPRTRASRIEKLIEIAKHLKQLFSFNMLYAFITGFNHCGVSRLKKTWEHVKPSSQKALSDLEELMSTMDNFRLYRKRLLSVPRTVCSIPLLSLILRDIEFLNVNSAKLRNGLWNFGKLRLIKNKISELERYKLIKPQNNIQIDDEIIAYCRNLPAIPSDQIYDLSLEREPKDQPKAARPISASSYSSVATSSSS